MWVKLDRLESRKMKDPVLLVALSTSMQQYRALYSQARELADYMTGHMKFEEVAVIHSSAFAPEVMVREDGISSLPNCTFLLHGGKTRDVLLLAGDSSPMDDQYEFTRLVLDYAKECGVKELFSVGARWTENPVSAYQDPSLNGFATDAEGVTALERWGIKPVKGEPAPFFSSLVVAMAPDWGMRGYKLSVDHGEPAPHTRTVLAMLKLLSEAVGFEVDLGELTASVEAPPAERKGDGGTIYR